jgi:hypothetical protein
MTQEEFENLMNEMHSTFQAKVIPIEWITQVMYSQHIGMFEINVN